MSKKLLQNDFWAQKWFDKCVQALLIFLPWSTVLSVFLVYKIGVPGGNFLKEILLGIIGILWLVLIFNKWKTAKKFPIQWGWLDSIILAYILMMTVVTIFTTGVRGLIFGGRYDFIFLIVFWIFYHGSDFLKFPMMHYIRIFLISSGIMLLVSGLLKFPLSEELLLYLGYSQYVSAWDFGGAPPIFHGIDGASVRRFQGLLDGPNTMGAFLIIFMGLITYFFHQKKDWYFAIGLVVFVAIVMVFYTYSRSAVLGMIGGAVVALLGGLGFLFQNYKKQLLALILIGIGFGWILMVKYSGSSESLIGREGSTKGHAERMLVGVNRFLEKPLGHGMGSAGPAYRHVLKLESHGRDSVEEQDRYYIPESWYIQQFIE